MTESTETRTPTYQIERITLWPQDRSNDYRLDSLLQQGWEPFATTTSTSGVFTYHLRRLA